MEELQPSKQKHLKVAEVAEILNVSTKKVKSLIEEEGLPAIDLGGNTRRVPAEEFEVWKESRRIRRTGSEESEAD